MTYRFLFTTYFSLYFFKIAIPGGAIFYALSSLVGLLFIPYALRFKLSMTMLLIVTISYILVCVGSHDRYLESYFSLYILAISNISIFSYIYFLVLKGDRFKLNKIKNDIKNIGLIIFMLIFIMELKVGGLVKVDYINLFGVDINRNSVHPIVLCFLYIYSTLTILLKSKNERLKFNHAFFILAVIIMILSNSRAAQAASLLVFVFYLFSSYSFQERYLILSLITIFGMFFILFVDFSFLTERLNKSGENSGLESSRFIMWSCYYNNFEISQLIFGLHEAGRDQCAYLPRVIGKNPHNSIIWSASVYGFITLFILFALIKNLTRAFFKKEYLYFILILCYIFIMNFERAYIVSPLDVPLLLLIFLPLLIKKLKLSSSNQPLGYYIN
ncbi:O-antigen ligase family protein [Proteus sp. WDL240414]|uniref:O-antigen ligase family protein n=2 Tax=Proteus TaxID=583 RepID=A0A6I7D2Q0_9GAMM|nr:O-antigen ligase family protein [Proteus columbae]MBG2803756.1 O-antigen ligase family protein [Proteus mirabilis]MBG3020203.1 O-antigen ligase family protein [Proteus mirabilis]QHN09004.1 O-antigen ligase family protein [Proteus columbae]